MMTPAKRVFLASVFACIFSGCGDSNRARIIGSWGIDRADIVLKRVNQDPEIAPVAAESNSEPKMLVEFQQDGQLVTKTQMGAVVQEKKGNWKFVSYDDSNNRMTVSCDIQMQTSELDVLFIDENTIELIPPNLAGLSMKLRFKRQSSGR